MARDAMPLLKNEKLSLAFYNRGNAYRRKDDRRAMADYNEAIRLDPKNVSTFYNRGNTYRNKGDDDRTITPYNEAIRRALSIFAIGEG
jgi:tetratricopeptide (TPR) repeat protein